VGNSISTRGVKIKGEELYREEEKKGDGQSSLKSEKEGGRNLPRLVGKKQRCLRGSLTHPGGGEKKSLSFFRRKGLYLWKWRKGKRHKEEQVSRGRKRQEEKVGIIFSKRGRGPAERH